MARAKTIHELRGEVKANDKFAAAGTPEPEAVALIATNYHTTEDSARAFVQWLKGAPSGRESADSPKTPGGVLESWHRQGDLAKGVEKLLSDDESAKARKTKGRKK
jgi:hypothetical protein